MANSQTKKQEKRVRKIKKNHTLLTLIIFGFVVFATVGILEGFAGVIIQYMVSSKLKSEYDSICYMADIYESGKSAGVTDAIYGLLDREGREYIVEDADGNAVYTNGNNTCDNDGGGYARLSETLADDSDDYKVYIYPDSETGYIYPNKENGEVFFDWQNLVMDLIHDKELISSFEKTNEDYNNVINFSIESYDPDEMDDEDLGARVHAGIDSLDTEPIKDSTGMLTVSSDNVALYVPVWMVADLNEGRLIGKAFLQINTSDLFIFSGFAVILLFLAFLMFIVVLISVISSAVNQRRMLKVFFTDVVTSGHNWMWFLYKGEQFLRRGTTARNTYAVLNLVFVKYRNYCVCHSIADGERMLKKVYNHINRKLEKKEMIAHVSNSNFALLLRYDDADKLKMRIQSLILELEKIDPDHVFSFQVGVDPIEVRRNEKGRVVRRKDIDIEAEYNNACTARSTLGDNDESGVAFFDTKLVEDQKWIDKVTERQRYAVEHEEFVVYYQPKYDPTTDKLRGAEALVRWQSQEMGFVPPGRFIPIFEKNGFITEIDHYMLEHVARDQKAWLDKGYECVPVSVNVSRAHFIESDLAEQIRDIVDRAGTPHKYIEIELTESAFFDDKKALISTITRLKEYGFAVSMDDFGSGYSSLNSLKDMPLDVLKLDAEFFRGDSQGDRGEIVVSEAIKLAKSLNMRTVAEGVEVKEQVDFLAKQGCDMIQGYYYAKPMPKEEYEQRM